ncbi:uncharacterized protein LOC128989022 [Macrosteles quadrilineatus]|uniref:uncharacterized protein LOC128989022 n=1 Tax=Macrosteles quadrilineatus TaxID=74068 RepID=UPI0023E1CB17|nr:uncharacterized protein LOC128989022 [Macrosteles quadrilineatus]
MNHINQRTSSSIYEAPTEPHPDRKLESENRSDTYAATVPTFPSLCPSMINQRTSSIYEAPTEPHPDRKLESENRSDTYAATVPTFPSLCPSMDRIPHQSDDMAKWTKFFLGKAFLDPQVSIPSTTEEQTSGFFPVSNSSAGKVGLPDHPNVLDDELVETNTDEYLQRFTMSPCRESNPHSPLIPLCTEQAMSSHFTGGTSKQTIVDRQEIRKSPTLHLNKSNISPNQTHPRPIDPLSIELAEIRSFQSPSSRKPTTSNPMEPPLFNVKHPGERKQTIQNSAGRGDCEKLKSGSDAGSSSSGHSASSGSGRKRDYEQPLKSICNQQQQQQQQQQQKQSNILKGVSFKPTPPMSPPMTLCEPRFLYGSGPVEKEWFALGVNISDPFKGGRAIEDQPKMNCIRPNQYIATQRLVERMVEESMINKNFTVNYTRIIKDKIRFITVSIAGKQVRDLVELISVLRSCEDEKKSRALDFCLTLYGTMHLHDTLVTVRWETIEQWAREMNKIISEEVRVLSRNHIQGENTEYADLKKRLEEKLRQHHGNFMQMLGRLAKINDFATFVLFGTNTEPTV